MAYNIVLTAGEAAITFDNGDTASLNMTTAVSAKVQRTRQFVQTAVIPPTVSLTTAITIVTSYKVMIHFNDESVYEIIMGEVDNQPTWVNTQAGANLCVTAVQASFA